MRKDLKALWERRIAPFQKEGPVRGQTRIIRYFANTFLGNGHEGFAAIALKHKINVFDLAPGEFVIFMNRPRTAIKLFAPGNVVAYLKMPGDRVIDPKVISLIPKFFNGTEIQYDRALKEMIEKEFKQK